MGVVDSAQLFKPTTKLDKFLEVRDSSEHNWTRAQSFSFSFWFLSKGNNLNNNQVLIGKGFPSMGFSMILISLDNSTATTKLKFELKNLTGTSADIADLASSTDIVTNQWYHVTAVYSGAASPDPVKMQLYVNGVKDELTVNSFDESGFTGKGMTFGYWNAYPGANTYPFNGAMDEISLFNKALSETEISDMETAALNGLPICRPGNYAPVITSTPVTAATQGVAYAYTVSAIDHDGDPLTWSAPVLPSWLSFNATTKILSGTPGNANVGDTVVNLMVTDGQLEIHQEFTISVANVNDAPVITSVPADTVINQGDTFSYTLTASDPDAGDAVTLSAPTLPSWMTFDPATGVLEGLATNDQVMFAVDSVFTVELKATDKSGADATQQFTVRVINVNDPPQVTGQSTIETDRNVPVDITIADLTIVDPDNHPADLELILLDGDHYSVNGQTITPDLNYYGDLMVNTEVTDQRDTIDYSLAVTVNFVNLPPEFTSTPLTTATQGVAYTYLVSASDPDVSDPNLSQTLTIWAETLPSWLTFNPSNKVLVGIPGAADKGNADVSLGVTDGVDTVFQTFTIEVTGENTAPQITGQQTVDGTKNGYVVLTVSDLIITDPDNPTSDMTLTVLAGDNYSFNGDTVFFAQDYLGTVNVGVKVNDGLDDSNVFQLSITVKSGVGVPRITNSFVDRVYPNPASDMVTFELSNTEGASRFLEVRDLTGKVMILRKIESGTREFRVNVSDFARGIYIYRVYSDTHYQIGKLLIQ